jgi:hypothetical protein
MPHERDFNVLRRLPMVQSTTDMENLPGKKATTRTMSEEVDTEGW